MILSKRQKKIGLAVLVIVLVAFLVGSGSSIVTLWKSVYILEGQSLGAYNSVQLDVLNSVERSYKSIFRPRKTDVEQVRLYVSEKNQNHLSSALPYSAKDWVQGLILDTGKLKKISLKHRGDNPSNWLHDKKSWRIKRKKSDLKDGMRVFNYSLPRDTALINTYLGYYIAEKMNIPAPKYNFVELYINDKYQGLYLETQHMDENFLRMNQSMPVNIYKGTPSRTDKPLNLDSDLFNNPSLWEKRAIFNARAESDYSDLEQFLILIRASVNDPSKMKELEKMANIERWANFSAYETIMQSWHNYEKNNMYLISDPWRVEIYPIAYDTIFNDTKSRLDITEPFKMDNGAHALTEVYSNNSKFLYAKHQILSSLVEQNFYSDIKKEATQIYEFIRQSWRDDPSHVQFVLTNEFEKNLIFTSGMDGEFEKLLKRIDFIEEALRRSMDLKKSILWNRTKIGFDLTVNGYVPTKKIKICSNDAGLLRNLELTERSPYEFKGTADRNGCYIFDIALTASRVKPQGNRSRITTFAASNGFIAKPTTFPFRTSSPIQIDDIFVMFSGSEVFERSTNSLALNKGSRATNNNPINLVSSETALVWQGDLYIEDLLVVDRPLTILPGTTINLGHNASIIFKNRVNAAGTKDKKIRFLRSGDLPWGIVALGGEGTNDSRFEYTDLSGGSGGTFDGHVFTGMFSVYSANRINLAHLSVSNNVNYDDLIHILYSNEITLVDSKIFNAMSDAIDIDISDIEISNCSFINAGNDAIDSMTSSVKVRDTKIMKAGDKGISAGESSKVSVVNVSFTETEIAIQSKDGTFVSVVDSKFLNNKIQLDAYQKNWRYGSGGEIKVTKSFFEGYENRIKAKNKSKITVIDSSFNSTYEHLKTKRVSLKNNYLVKQSL